MSDNGVKMPDLSGIIDMISKNPDLVRNAMSAISGMSGTVSDSASQDTEKEVSAPASAPAFDPSALNALLPKLSQVQRPRNDEKPNHHDLLCALRPYLSPERRTVIDRMLEFGQIGDLLKSFEGKNK